MSINYDEQVPSFLSDGNEPGAIEFEKPKSKKPESEKKHSSDQSSHPFGEAEDEKIRNEDIKKLEEEEKKAG
jgi:hypothetical protein